MVDEAVPVLYGAAYNVYVRVVRLALAEKGVDYQLIEVDLGAEEGAPANYLHHQSVMRIPAFEHEGERLYEASAITRYIDEAFDGPALMPHRAQERARVNQKLRLRPREEEVAHGRVSRVHARLAGEGAEGVAGEEREADVGRGAELRAVSARRAARLAKLYAALPLQSGLRIAAASRAAAA